MYQTDATIARQIVVALVATAIPTTPPVVRLDLLANDGVGVGAVGKAENVGSERGRGTG